MWLGLIAASRNLCFLPLAMFLTVVTLSQTVFYLRYHYY
jgi:hypothetical protein